MSAQTLTYSSKFKAYMALTKPRLTLLVLFSALTGYYLGNVGSLDFVHLAQTLFGIALASSGSLALNQFIERKHDAKMARTRKRPLPNGAIKASEALVFGISLCVFSLVYLAIVANPLTTLLVFLTIISYLFAYTPLKRHTSMNTAVGAISGALPILCGWVAVQNAINIHSLILFGILFLWQFPHFLSIALLYREDYDGAGYKMLPSDTNGIARTNWHIIATTLLLIALSATTSFVGLTGNLYLFIALFAGFAFLYYGFKAVIRQTQAAAKNLLYASFIYPLVIWIFMMVDKTPLQ